MAPASAIIIAAGRGRRMESYTDEIPKCLLRLGDKTMLERQLEAYRDCGIVDISLVKGYQREKIQLPGLRYFENPEYARNNILVSLFCAEPAIDGPVVCAYADILFEKSVVQRLLDSQHDISIVVDIDWRDYYVGRVDHPVEEAESVIFDAHNRVCRIGKILPDKDGVNGEFIGMLKLSPRGADIFKQHYHRAKESYWGKPFQLAPVMEKAYVTDLIQEMVNLGEEVHCILIERGWKEIDTVEDYQNALKEFTR